MTREEYLQHENAVITATTSLQNALAVLPNVDKDRIRDLQHRLANIATEAVALLRMSNRNIPLNNGVPHARREG